MHMLTSRVWCKREQVEERNKKKMIDTNRLHNAISFQKLTTKNWSKMDLLTWADLRKKKLNCAVSMNVKTQDKKSAPNMRRMNGKEQKWREKKRKQIRSRISATNL